MIFISKASWTALNLSCIFRYLKSKYSIRHLTVASPKHGGAFTNPAVKRLRMCVFLFEPNLSLSGFVRFSLRLLALSVGGQFGVQILRLNVLNKT